MAIEIISPKKPNFEFNLHPVQGIAFASDAEEILYGGAASGGKSYMMRLLAIYIALNVESANCVIFRKNFRELKLNHMAGFGGFKNILKPLTDYGSVEVLDGNEPQVRFKENGSKIILLPIDTSKDKEKVQGVEITFMGVDELTQQPTNELYNYARTRCRCVGNQVDQGLAAPMPMQLPRILNGSNPGGAGHCVPHGDVLTPDRGWVDIKDMRVSDSVYTVSDDGEMVEATVEQIHEHEASDIHRVSMRGLTIECTGDHKIAKLGGIRCDRGRKFSLVPFTELPGQAYIKRTVNWVGRDIDCFSVNNTKPYKVKHNQPDNITGVDYAELMGWFLSEGHTVARDFAFGISQIKEPQRTRISQLLIRCGFIHSTSKNGYLIYSRKWYDYFSRFGKCREKYIPNRILESSDKYLRAFFTAAMDGDGHWSTRHKSGEYYSTSKRLIDGMQEIAIKLGYITYVSERQRDERLGLSYTLNFKESKLGGTEILTGNHKYNVNTITKRKSNIEKITESKTVYCIGVPDTHNFIIRQNGSMWVSGNCWVKKAFVDPRPPMETWDAPIGEDPETGEILYMKRQYIPAKVADNPTIDAKRYRANLAGAGDKETVKALLNGDWNVFQGSFFGDVFFDDKHVVEPIRPNELWTIFRALDWGTAHPYAVGWFAELMYAKEDQGYRRGDRVMIREMYGANPDKANAGVNEQADVVARKIKVIDKEMFDAFGVRVNAGGGDDAMFACTGGVSPGDLFTAEGVHWIRVKQGQNFMPKAHALMNVRGWLERARDGEPRGFYIVNTCRNTINILPSLPRSETQPDVIDKRSEDHIADMIDYAFRAGSGINIINDDYCAGRP